MSATEIQLDYRDLSSLRTPSQSEDDAPAGRLGAGAGRDGVAASVAGGGALAFTGRARGRDLCIDFAAFVDRGP